MNRRKAKITYVHREYDREHPCGVELTIPTGKKGDERFFVGMGNTWEAAKAEAFRKAQSLPADEEETIVVRF